MVYERAQKSRLGESLSFFRFTKIATPSYFFTALFLSRTSVREHRFDFPVDIPRVLAASEVFLSVSCSTCFNHSLASYDMLILRSTVDITRFIGHEFYVSVLIWSDLVLSFESWLSKLSIYLS